MDDASSPPRRCYWCQGPTGPSVLTISEGDTTASWVNDWSLCSWACVHELVARQLRSSDRGAP